MNQNWHFQPLHISTTKNPSIPIHPLYTPTKHTQTLTTQTNGLLAQSVERWSNKPTVKSSNLLESTILYIEKSHGLAVEHFINTEKIRVRLSVGLLNLFLLFFLGV